MASMTLKLEFLPNFRWFLSALIFIGLTCEVVRTKLDLGNLKTKILGEKCQKGREHPVCSPLARPQLAFGEQLLRELAFSEQITRRGE